MDLLKFEIEDSLRQAEQMTNCKIVYKTVAPKRDIKHMFKKRKLTTIDVPIIIENEKIASPKRKKTTHLF